MTPENPVAVGAAFLSAVTEPAGPDVALLRELVTPESREMWGDFSEVGEGLADPVKLPLSGACQDALVVMVWRTPGSATDFNLEFAT